MKINMLSAIRVSRQEYRRSSPFIVRILNCFYINNFLRTVFSTIASKISFTPEGDRSCVENFLRYLGFMLC